MFQKNDLQLHHYKNLKTYEEFRVDEEATFFNRHVEEEN
jgi:hypothetical protein